MEFESGMQPVDFSTKFFFYFRGFITRMVGKQRKRRWRWPVIISRDGEGGRDHVTVTGQWEWRWPITAMKPSASLVTIKADLHNRI